ncbi:exported hypothetical protein [Candidatus Magnetomoraceae bacterium gMMP-15]
MSVIFKKLAKWTALLLALFVIGCGGDDNVDSTKIFDNLAYNEDKTSISGTFTIELKNILDSQTAELKNFEVTVGSCDISGLPDVTPDLAEFDSQNTSQDLSVNVSFVNRCFEETLILKADKIVTTTGKTTTSKSTEKVTFKADLQSQTTEEIQETHKIILFTSKTIIKPDNSDQAVITAKVINEDHVYLSNVNVKFSATDGILTNGSDVTDSEGKATTYFSSGIIGTGIVTAEVAGLDSVQISIEVKQTPSSISLSRSKLTIKPDNLDSAAIIAIVVDENNTAISGVSVTFSTTGGELSSSSAITNESGKASTSFSSASVGTAVIIAEVDGIDTVQTEIEVKPVADKLSLTTSSITVKSDNSDSATVKAVVQDENYVPLEGITANFSTSGGLITSSSAVTDENGEASINFSSGTIEKKNQIVNISAQVSGIEEIKQVPIQIIGTTINLSADTTNLEINGSISTLKIELKDAGLNSIYDALVTVTTEPANSNAITWNLVEGYKDYKTNLLGELELEVEGLSEEDKITLTVEALGAQASQNYIVSSVGEAFGISEPTPSSDGYVSLLTNESLSITVNAPDVSTVNFSTTLGSFTGVTETAQVLSVAVTNNSASAVLKSDWAGVATVQIYDPNSPTSSDTLKVVFSAPSDDAERIILQSNTSVVAPSSGNLKNTAALTAIVRTSSYSGSQVVAGAPVLFSIEKPTGSGEFISPGIVYTDKFGVATTTFTSGSLSSGSEGIDIKASIVGTEIDDTFNIIIGGTAGSIVIGLASEIDVVSNTLYSMPISLIVADSNGNSMPGAVVSLSVWPEKYYTGYWTEDPCEPKITGPFNNEDVNKNLMLDPGEDLNGDEQLTPPNSAAGTLPKFVTTDEYGVANFELTYLKASAPWIGVKIEASTIVLGTETVSHIILDYLPYAEGEECDLPNSYYTGPIKEITAHASPSSPVFGSESEITVTVKDISDNLVNGMTVNMELIEIDHIKYGSLNKTTGLTQNGEVTFIYTAPSEAEWTSRVTLRAYLPTIESKFEEVYIDPMP